MTKNWYGNTIKFPLSAIMNGIEENDMDNHNWNNVELKYRGKTISIAQHAYNNEVHTQEILATIPDEYGDDRIIHFGDDLVSLINALTTTRDLIDIDVDAAIEISEAQL